MKNTVKLIALCLGLVAMQTIHTFSVSDTWNKAKNTAQSGYESAKATVKSAPQSVKQGWENLDESTKNAIIGAGVATVGAGAAAGAGYAGYKAYENNNSVYGPGPSEKEIFNKPSLSGSGKTVGQEASEYWTAKTPQQNSWYSQRPRTDIITDED